MVVVVGLSERKRESGWRIVKMHFQLCGAVSEVSEGFYFFCGDEEDGSVAR